MSDPEKTFDLIDKSYLNHFKTIYMNFYVFLKHLLIKNHIPHRVKFYFFHKNTLIKLIKINIENEQIIHPIQLENEEPRILNNKSGN